MIPVKTGADISAFHKWRRCCLCVFCSPLCLRGVPRVKGASPSLLGSALPGTLSRCSVFSCELSCALHLSTRFIHAGLRITETIAPPSVKADVRLWPHNLFKSTSDSSCAGVIGSSPSSYTTVIAGLVTHWANSPPAHQVHIPICLSECFRRRGTRRSATVLPPTSHS